MADKTTLLGFVDHEHNCDWLQVNWHKGPCDCGLHALIDTLSHADLMQLENANPGIVESYRLAKKS